MERENERVQHDLSESLQRALVEQQERTGLIGHIKYEEARNKQTIFSAVTFKYLDLSDLVKLLQLSKGTRELMLSRNFNVFTQHVYV